MTTPSRTLVEALDRITETIRSKPDLAIGRDGKVYEEVFVLQVDATRRLVGDPAPPGPETVWFYELTGDFTDLTGAFAGMGKMREGFTFVPATLGDPPVIFEFPEPLLGEPPFHEPPETPLTQESTRSRAVGYTKTHCEFPDGSNLYSVGPSVTKLIYPLKDPGFQLWQTHNGIVARGDGRFEGARGMVTSFTSANLLDLGLDPVKEPFKSGYPVKVLVCIKVITADKLGQAGNGDH